MALCAVILAALTHQQGCISTRIQPAESDDRCLGGMSGTDCEPPVKYLRPLNLYDRLISCRGILLGVFCHLSSVASNRHCRQ